jgi:hypothetical protein
MTILIDLRKMRKPLANDIGASLLAFSSQHQDTPICTVALFGDGFHGRASLFLDTPDHSAASVQWCVEKGLDWYGEDDQGRFCESPCDFPCLIGEYRFSGYPDLYKTGSDGPARGMHPAVDYITLEGVKVRAEAAEGNEGNNRIVFPFLRAVLASFEPFAQLSRAAPFRAGVRMLGSRLLEFWSVEIGKGGS